MVDDACLGPELRRDPFATGPQAEVHVLVEQERAGIERPEPPEEVGARRDARGDGPADAPGLGASPRFEALGSRPGQQACREQRPRDSGPPAGQEVDAVLRRAVGVQQARDQERVTAGSRPRQLGEASVRNHAVGVQQDGRGMPGARDPGVVGGAEAGIAVQRDDFCS